VDIRIHLVADIFNTYHLVHQNCEAL